MRILHLHTKINLTCGISKTIFLIAKNLDREFEQFVFTLGGDAITKFKGAGINILQSVSKSRDLFQTLKILIEIIRITKTQNIDIIHSHHRYFDLLAYIVSLISRVKTVTSVHNKVYGKITLSYKAQRLIACSHSIKQHLIDYFGINEEKIIVIYNFIDIHDINTTFDKAILTKQLGIKEESKIIGFVGRFNIQEKGIDILLESFKKVSSSFKTSVLILIGEGRDIKYIKNFIHKNIINVIVLSPREKIFDFYNIFDIVLIPSRVEPFGIVAIEAGLMKKPVIASNVDGLKEIIDSGINGILFPSESIELLTKSIIILFNNTEMRSELGKELYKKVMNNFTSEKCLPKYRSTYEELNKKEW